MAIKIDLPAPYRSVSMSYYQSINHTKARRFARNDGNMSSVCDTGDRSYCGGTWRGIMDQLDYIQGMGFTAVCHS